MTDEVDGDRIRDYFVVETKRHKPCLIYHGFRYVQDKIQNRTIYWRCEDRAHCNGRAHQLVENGSLPLLTIKHNHPPMMEDFATNGLLLIHGQCRPPRRTHLKTTRDPQQRQRGKRGGISFSRLFTSTGGVGAPGGAVDRSRAVDKERWEMVKGGEGGRERETMDEKDKTSARFARQSRRVGEEGKKQVTYLMFFYIRAYVCFA